ncbi:unnamed protein product [Albugo candida]|uniref:Uncharacterized protein n=1 Tax=Albugo candida TaxID=65357 RepID=A0A024FT72_9STRA|nr:unnamed protein product [Albugo candida]|eukprot:CCI10288.1 unnamed protein product [Albugo candida]
MVLTGEERKCENVETCFRTYFIQEYASIAPVKEEYEMNIERLEYEDETLGHTQSEERLMKKHDHNVPKSNLMIEAWIYRNLFRMPVAACIDQNPTLDCMSIICNMMIRIFSRMDFCSTFMGKKCETEKIGLLYCTKKSEVYVKCLIVSNHLVGWGLSIEIDIVSKVYQRLFDEYNKPWQTWNRLHVACKGPISLSRMLK